MSGRGAASSDLESRIRNAVKSLAHRGPDGCGHLIHHGVALGHTRLSIIDVSDAASQPMRSADGRYAIVFNGEIYNYKELFVRYCPSDGSVNGNSDTAVLFYLLQTHGASCLEWLDGMFAFGFVDFSARTLLLARDRFGEKPLYYRQDADIFAFASELKTLRTLLPDRSWELATDCIGIYHVVGSIPAPRTIYRDVRALPAASYMIVRDGRVEDPRAYWNLASVKIETEVDFSSAREAVEALLLRAVRSRLVSDVPVGLFLSGGFDSSAILSCCAALGHPQTIAVCIDFEEPGYSEFPKAASVAKHYGATVHRHLITKRLFEQSLDGFFAAMDQPTCDGYNTYFVCGAAKEFGVKVWLSGVGGDELFGGYQSFRRMGNWSRVSSAMQRIISPDRFMAATDHLDRLRLSRILHMSDRGDPRLRAYQACRNSVPWRNALCLLDDDRFTEGLGDSIDSCYPQVPPESDAFQSASLMESSVYMRSQLLRDIDNFSMAHSLELRAPLLEFRLFESVYSMPEAIKRHGDTIKPLLGASVPIAFPESILRQSKQGFGFPVDSWLRKGLEQSFVETLDSTRHFRIWDAAQVARLWSGYRSQQIHWSILWNIFAFAKWLGIQHADA